MVDVMDKPDSQEHRGHTLSVRRVDVETVDYHRTTDYEFELHIDGVLVTTATHIEQTANYEHPWIPALFRYGRAFVDGYEIDRLEDQ